MAKRGKSPNKKQKQNLEMQRERRKQRIFGGLIASSAVISQVCENVRSALQPKKSSAASVSSAFQGFAFGFGRRTFEVRRP
jgi:hypothetical protein